MYNRTTIPLSALDDIVLETYALLHNDHPPMVSTVCEAGLISIIVPTYNRAKFLGKLLESVLSQAWRPIELIVVDDGSTDNTLEVLTSLAPSQDISLRILSQINGGPASARNLGIRHARGEFVYFLDSDDLLLPGGLDHLLVAIRESNAPFAIGRVMSVEAGQHNPLRDREGIPFYSVDKPFASAWAIHAALYRRTALVITGAFDEAIKIGEDTELRWRICASGLPPALLDQVVAIRQLHDQGHLSSSCLQAAAAQSNLIALERHLARKPNGAEFGPAPRRFRLRNLAYGLALGAQGDFENQARAAQLIARISRRNSIVTLAAAGIARCRSRRLSSMLQVLCANAIRAARLADMLLQSHHRGQQ